MPRSTTLATDRLEALKAAPVELRPQSYDSWLEVATAAQVRRHWRRWMGVFPGWARIDTITTHPQENRP
mgnify:CR=1 FL=1